MAAVINHLRFRDPVDPDLFADADATLVPRMRAIEGFRGLHVVQTGEREIVLVILGDTVEVLDQIATEVGSPWMVEHVVPLLDGPPGRHLGPELLTVV